MEHSVTMSCSRPFYLKNVRSVNGPVPIPCGYCLSCRADKRTVWQRRLQFEYSKTPACAFVTFTYDDEHVPIAADGKHLTVRRADVCKYLDDLRHIVKYHKEAWSKYCDPHFKYFVVSEYGEHSDRPHYHALFFGLDYHKCATLFKKYWHGGIVKVLPIQKGGIRYVLKYLDKNGSFDKHNRIMNYQEPNFRLVSKGIGEAVMKEQVDNVAKYGVMKFGQRCIPMPTYYRNKYVAYSDRLVDNVKKAFKESKKRVCEQQGLRNYEQAAERARHARERKLYAQARRQGTSAINVYANPVTANKPWLNPIEEGVLDGSFQ